MRVPRECSQGRSRFPGYPSACGSVLILPRRGHSDRDGNSRKLAAGVYRDLTHRSSGQGFITLRYHKRGTGHMLHRTDKPLNMMTLMKLYKLQCKEPIDTELLGIIR